MNLAPHPYGSDKDGLICGFLFQPGQAGQPMNLAAAKAWLAQHNNTDSPDPAAGFIWLHFNLSDAKAEDWIKTHLPVVPEFLNGRAYTIFGGSSEIQRDIVAKMVLGL